MFSKITTSISKLFLDPTFRFNLCANAGLYNRLSDERFLKIKFKAYMGKKLDLQNPHTFNEKLQWLKLYNRCSEYTVMADKYEVRGYIKRKLGEEFLIPLLGVWDDPDEIDFDNLPNRFVLKCNHNSGVGMCICNDKSNLDINKVRAELRIGLNQNYYLLNREWPYKNIPRKIICEQYMEDSSQKDSLTDYKFFCFNGVSDCVMVCLDRFSGDTKFYFFDKNWELKRLNIRGKNAPEGFTIPKPSCMDEMFRIAEKLSTGLPFSRIDLYECNGKVYFGEITFFPDSGFDANLLPETNQYFGEMIDLSLVKN